MLGHLKLVLQLFQMNLLSPSILSLHNDGGSMERKLSISELLGAFKLINEQDQNALLELISEASGLTEAIQQIHVCLHISHFYQNS